MYHEHSNQFDAGQNAVPARNVNKSQQAPKPFKRQTLNNFFFEKLWKVTQKTKVVHYFDNCNRFFFQGQNFKHLAENQVAI